MKKVLVTGPSGFVGKRLTASQCKDGDQLIPWSIRDRVGLPEMAVDAIVHCAGIAHQMKPVPDEYYFEVNHLKTIELAKLAKSRGVNHFVFLSSTKVYGDKATSRDLCESSDCNPTDAYGRSKLKAEIDLQSLQCESFFVSVIRPPMVFGPDVKGNFRKLIELCDSNWPLPFHYETSRRSMVFVDNLIAMINRILELRMAGIFVAGEQEAVSLSFLASQIRKLLNRPQRLFRPSKIMLSCARMLAPAQVSRLFDEFIVDNQLSQRRLHFAPPYTTSQGLETTVRWYLSKR